jgi:hypothetical protein
MIYCEPKTDRDILAELDGSKKVLLLGCSLCSNISYCIHNQMKSPMFQGLDVAVNTKREATRLRQLMSKKGIQSDSMTLMALCCISTKDVKKVIKKSEDCDTIATLSCEFGRKNTEEYSKGKSVVGTMRNKGFMRTIVDQKGLTISFLKDTLYVNDKKYSG